MDDAWADWLDGALGELADDELLRDLEPLEAQSAVHVRAEDRPLTLFSTNDYLGLSSHPQLKERTAAAARELGSGPRGSPLICGYTERHRALESELSELEMTESTLLFPTGFAANLGVLSALAGPDVEIFSDELNHASIIDGCRLGRRMGAELQVYDHADPASLDAALEASDADRTVVVTDTVFSMDGTLAPLPELVEVKERHGALLVVDEAHATLVFGETGAGVTEHFGVSDAVDVNVGTLSKAFGALGGFASTTERLRTWILNSGRSYIYSTAPPVPVVEAARSSLRTVREDPSVRRRLRENVERVASAADVALESPIVPIVVGAKEEALRASRQLFERGLHCTAIRPPTVPPGTSRLRATITAAHTDDDIDRLLAALEELGLVDAVAGADAEIAPV